MGNTPWRATSGEPLASRRRQSLYHRGHFSL